jgi:NTE family protein
MVAQAPPIADLILEGGGVKGNALVGAAAAFEESGYRFNRLAGTSAGSMVAVLLGAGIPAARLHDMMLTFDYSRFVDPTSFNRIHFGGIGAVLSELVERGLYRGDALREILAEWLSESGVTTFADFRIQDPGLDPNVPNDWRFRVVMVASDLTRQTMIRVPWDLRRVYGIDPDAFSVALGVRMSTAIPFFYVPVPLRSELNGQTSFIVDGGLTSGFPVHIFDRTDGLPPRWPTFHVALATARPPFERAPDLKGRTDLLRAVVNTALHGRVNAERDDAVIASFTVAIDTSYVATTDFSLDQATRQRLFEDGYAAGRRFLSSFDFEAYRRLKTAVAPA